MKTGFVIGILLAIISVIAFAQSSSNGLIATTVVHLDRAVPDALLDDDTSLWALNAPVHKSMYNLVRGVMQGRIAAVSSIEYRHDKKSFLVTFYFQPQMVPLYDTIAKQYKTLLSETTDLLNERLDNGGLDEKDKNVAKFKSVDALKKGDSIDALCFDENGQIDYTKCYGEAVECTEDKECPNFSICEETTPDNDNDDVECNDIEEGQDGAKPCPAGQVCSADGTCIVPKCNDIEDGEDDALPCPTAQECIKGECKDITPTPASTEGLYALSTGTCSRKASKHNNSVLSVTTLAALAVAFVCGAAILF